MRLPQTDPICGDSRRKDGNSFVWGVNTPNEGMAAPMETPHAPVGRMDMIPTVAAGARSTLLDVGKFVERYPRLFHMAEAGTWPSIKERGLLSTSAVLDLVGLNGGARAPYESQHRPEKMTVGAPPHAVVLRDQKPMPPNRISQALVDGTSPQEWYELLNGKVFMWAEETRLLTLLQARAYRSLEHDVLTIDTGKLVAEYKDKISLCRMNSGNTFPYWHARGKEDFLPIERYPARQDGSPLKGVVEVVVDYAIRDVASYVVQVRRMKGAEVLDTIGP